MSLLLFQSKYLGSSHSDVDEEEEGVVEMVEEDEADGDCGLVKRRKMC